VRQSKVAKGFTGSDFGNTMNATHVKNGILGLAINVIYQKVKLVLWYDKITNDNTALSDIQAMKRIISSPAKYNLDLDLVINFIYIFTKCCYFWIFLNNYFKMGEFIQLNHD
jgi:hypothetical protein